MPTRRLMGVRTASTITASRCMKNSSKEIVTAGRAKPENLKHGGNGGINLRKRRKTLKRDSRGRNHGNRRNFYKALFHPRPSSASSDLFLRSLRVSGLAFARFIAEPSASQRRPSQPAKKFNFRFH